MALIPGKNPMAIVAYYLGIFSLIPCFGLVLGLPAIVCGILGLIHAGSRPDIEGQGHAIAGIAMGIIAPFAWAGLFYLVWIS